MPVRESVDEPVHVEVRLCLEEGSNMSGGKLCAAECLAGGHPVRQIADTGHADVPEGFERLFVASEVK